MKVWTSHIPIWSSSIGLQKKSPFTPFLTLSIEEIFESGFLNKIITKHFQRDSNLECLKEDDDTLKISLGLKKLISLFTILMIGMTIAILFLCVEKSYQLSKTFMKSTKPKTKIGTK